MPRLRRWIVPAAALIAAVAAGPAAAAASFGPAGPAATRAARPAVRICGTGPAVTRPTSMIVTCADDGVLAGHLHWSSWTAARAAATGVITWRACSTDCAASRRWDHASAAFTLAGPVHGPGGRMLFTRLTLHVTGWTPRGFIRQATFSEAPARPAPAAPPATRPAAARTPRRGPVHGAPSGTLGYAQIEGFWIIAGGPDGSAGSYTQAQVAAAITGPESSFLPGNIQQGADYCGAGSDRAGWGLWQITCGNSVPQYGSDFQLLDPWNNAEAAVYKCQQDMAAGDNCFDPWSTYLTGVYEQYLQHTAADTNLTDPGEYVQYAATPPGTPSSPPPDPGSTYGPPMPGSVSNPPAAAVTGSGTAYVFWKGTDANLWEAQGPADGALGAPYRVGMGPLGSAPTAGVNSKGDTYVFWKGTNGNLWEAYWTGSKWAGPIDQGMGTLGSAPSVAVTGNGTAYVFWKGTDGQLWEAQGAGDGQLAGPYPRGMGPLGSGPTAGVDSKGDTYVYWQGTDGSLWEGYWTGSKWAGPVDQGMGTLGSAPSVAVTGNGTAYVFWKGTDGHLWEAQGSATGQLGGPYPRGMGTLGSAPTVGVNSSGYTYVYWKGTDANLWEGYWTGSSWAGPSDRGEGPLGGPRQGNRSL